MAVFWLPSLLLRFYLFCYGRVPILQKYHAFVEPAFWFFGKSTFLILDLQHCRTVLNDLSQSISHGIC